MESTPKTTEATTATSEKKESKTSKKRRAESVGRYAIVERAKPDTAKNLKQNRSQNLKSR